MTGTGRAACSFPPTIEGESALPVRGNIPRLGGLNPLPPFSRGRAARDEVFREPSGKAIDLGQRHREQLTGLCVFEDYLLPTKKAGTGETTHHVMPLLMAHVVAHL